jgi:TolA-binding protein
MGIVTGEPDTLKGVRPVRRGADGKGRTTGPRQPPTLWNGYLPPFEFVPQLLAAQAQALLRIGDLAGAAGVYEEVLRRFPTSAVAAEAQYYRGVAKYKASHEPNDLAGSWAQLRNRYPESIWRVKQSFTESSG